MSLPIEIDKLNENLKNHKNFYMGRVMTRHIPSSKKDIGDIIKRKEVERIMSLELFQRNFQRIVFGINKDLGLVGTMNTLGAYSIIALNIQDPSHNIGYDFMEYFIDRIHEEIIVVQQGKLENFKFHHYSLIMHLIMFKNVDMFDQSFFESTQEWGERLPVQRWKRV